MQASLKAKAFKALVVEINEFTLNFCETEPADIFAFLHDCGYLPVETDEADKFSAREPVNRFFVPRAH
jgi:hypothetical protein